MKGASYSQNYLLEGVHFILAVGRGPSDERNWYENDWDDEEEWEDEEIWREHIEGQELWKEEDDDLLDEERGDFMEEWDEGETE